MSKKYTNTRQNCIDTIKYVIRNGPQARFRFDGSIYSYIRWSVSKWNKKHPDEKITKKDVGLTPELEKKLRRSVFLPKEEEENEPTIYCVNTYRPPGYPYGTQHLAPDPDTDLQSD